MNDKVLLLELKERTSGNGNRYMSGWLGKASVVAFLDQDAAEPTWQVYVSTPKPRTGQGEKGRPHQSGAGNNEAWRRDIAPRSAGRSQGRRQLHPGELDDSLDGIGSGHG